MRQQFLVNTADTLKTFVFENNRKIVPTSATITVYEPASTAEIVSAAAMTVGADGQLSYALTTAHNDDAAENYKVVIAYVYSAATYYATFYYDVVNSKLSKVITDDDVVNELPQLKDNNWRVRGTAESGSTTTIVDSELKRYEDDYFTGGLAYSIDKDEAREISDFVSSTGTVTVAAVFGSTIATDKYILTRSYTREIQRAFEKIEGLLVAKGKRAHLVLDPYDLREAHIYASVAEICKGLINANDNVWAWFYSEYDKKFKETFRGLNLKYDESGDGVISADEAGSAAKRVSNITAGRG